MLNISIGEDDQRNIGAAKRVMVTLVLEWLLLSTPPYLQIPVYWPFGLQNVES